MHVDHRPYFRFTGRARLEKSINSLLGLVEGVAVDGAINSSEAEFLDLWLDEHRDVQAQHPFNELFPVVQHAVSDSVLSEDERQDITWLCEQLRSAGYFDLVTADLQRLHGVLGGIAADGTVTADEVAGLAEWLGNHEHLRSCWPYDDVDSLVTAVMADRKIDEEEQKLLMSFFSEFTSILDSRTITSPKIIEAGTISGVCAVCPEIGFSGATFCFTGASFKYTREQFSEVVASLGGNVLMGVSRKLNYLIIGADGNPCWAYACYGRKVEKAIELRKNGARIILVHENDFHDAVADVGIA